MSEGPPLRKETRPEYAQVGHVTPEQPAGLLREPEDPFGAAALHPNRSSFNFTGQKINRRPHPGCDRHPQGPVMHRNPFLLFWTPKRNQQQIWFGGSNALF